MRLKFDVRDPIVEYGLRLGDGVELDMAEQTVAVVRYLRDSDPEWDGPVWGTGFLPPGAFHALTTRYFSHLQPASPSDQPGEEEPSDGLRRRSPGARPAGGGALWLVRDSRPPIGRKAGRSDRPAAG